jgi:hypothetical protein
MKQFLKRQWAFTTILLIGLIGWYVGTATIGEQYATAVGPDFLLKVPVAFVKLAVILWVSRLYIALRFPTIDAFTRQGSNDQSEFGRVWKTPMQNGHDPRLGYAVAVHLGVPFIVALIVLFAF